MNVKNSMFRIVNRLFHTQMAIGDDLHDITEEIVQTENLTCTNNIIVCTIDEKKYFFRECRKHLKIKQYFILVITDYLDNICQDNELCYRKEKICLDLNNKKNINKLRHFDAFYRKHWKLIKSGNFRDFDVIGLPSLNNCASDKSIPDFLKYLRSELMTYKNNSFVSEGTYQTFGASRCIATKKIADLLGLNRMIPDIDFVRLTVNGIEKVGTLMASADGIRTMLLTSEQKHHVHPEFQRELIKLNLLDVLCFQKDHKSGNYNVILDEQKSPCGVCAFDNDAPVTFFESTNIAYETYVRCSAIIRQNGTINRPFCDAQLADRIISLTNRDIQNALKNILSFSQICAVCVRLRKIQKMLKKTMKLNPEMFINDDKWSNETVIEELSGKYGMTYLKYFMECDEASVIEEIMKGT